MPAPSSSRQKHPQRVVNVRWLVLVLVVGALFMVSLQLSLSLSRSMENGAYEENRQVSAPSLNFLPTTAKQGSDRGEAQIRQRCALCFFGLPRSFHSLVLPSLIKNVIQPNLQHGCDYFVHYYQLDAEVAGRSGGGGRIDADEVRELRDTVQVLARRANLPLPKVEFVAETDASFWQRYQTLIDKIRHTKDSNGEYLYFPWMAKSYTHPTTTDNIIKMWHSIQASWQLMASHESADALYQQVAMLRSDVAYMTPIDIMQRRVNSVQKLTDSAAAADLLEHVAVVPGFGKYPVNDRLVYGPRRGVEIWAAQRFARMEAHVQAVAHNPDRVGWGLHSERFLAWTLFPAMQNEAGVQVVEHEHLCFFRARADETVWVSDCEGQPDSSNDAIVNYWKPNHVKKQHVEKVLGRKCAAAGVQKLKGLTRILSCPLGNKIR